MYALTWLILVCGVNNICYFADLKIDNFFLENSISHSNQILQAVQKSS